MRLRSNECHNCSNWNIWTKETKKGERLHVIHVSGEKFVFTKKDAIFYTENPCRFGYLVSELENKGIPEADVAELWATLFKWLEDEK